ncbi:MAG: glycosyltransferase [Alphaproteobacteria bacterium]|nr:glycosyltransferase [Alphaproteobacteria bacterium]
MRVVFWGTYDEGKPRVRILSRGLRATGTEIVEIHADIWSGIEDKGSIDGTGRKLWLLLRWLCAYPCLIWRYLRAPAHDAVMVNYLGHLDVLILWPFAKLRGVPVIWDAFISLYDTVVEDRRIFGPRHPLAWLLFAWEWLACRAARTIVLDTRAHAAYFAATFGVSEDKLASVFVGVEPESFPPSQGEGLSAGPLRVLFYGQFIPLHGIETIVRAAQAAYGDPIKWVLIGRGQEDAKIRALIGEAPADIEWIDWVEFAELISQIERADICLGIFGDTAKAARVIPNKVFQVVSAGAPLITRDSPAIRELLSPDMPGVFLVPPADPEALLQAVRGFAAGPRPARPLHGEIALSISPKAIGEELLALISNAAQMRRVGAEPP